MLKDRMSSISSNLYEEILKPNKSPPYRTPPVAASGISRHGATK